MSSVKLIEGQRSEVGVVSKDGVTWLFKRSAPLTHPTFC